MQPWWSYPKNNWIILTKKLLSSVLLLYRISLVPCKRNWIPQTSSYPIRTDRLNFLPSRSASWISGSSDVRLRADFSKGNLHFSINLATNTMANWVIKSADNYLSLVYDQFHQLIYDNHVIHADVFLQNSSNPWNFLQMERLLKKHTPYHRDHAYR